MTAPAGDTNRLLFSMPDLGFRSPYRDARNSVLALSKKLKSAIWTALMG
jgi:hypothetical protein